MTGLNYNHLYYFYRVAIDGGVTAASRNLHLTPQTISGQVSSLEDQIGFPLFERQGKQMKLTRRGRIVLSYAEDIFQLGEELKGVLKQPDLSEHLAIAVGIVDIIPKALSFSLLKPVTTLPTVTRFTCREGEFDHLLAELAVDKLDLVISDRPLPAGARLKAYNHTLLQTGVALFAAEDIHAEYRDNFPASLHGAPFLMPNAQTMLSQLLLGWFERKEIHPIIVGEFDDSALAKAFAQASMGVLAAPSVIAEDLLQNFGLHQLGLIDQATMQFYAISPHKKIVHPAVKAIIERQGIAGPVSSDSLQSDR